MAAPKVKFKELKEEHEQFRQILRMMRNEILTTVNVLIDFLIEEKKILTREELAAFVDKKFGQPKGAQCGTNEASNSPSLHSLNKS